MSKTKTSKPAKPAKITKASFVRGIASTVPAKEVVAKAKAVGMTLSEKHVYVIRSDAKKRSKKRGAAGKAAGGAAPSASPASTTSTAGKSTGGSGSNETNFRKLVLALGISKSRTLVSDVERRLNELISGR
ncbi:MAG: hypothetical protein ABI461_04945 [Polyangiaceae bacterium]